MNHTYKIYRFLIKTVAATILIAVAAIGVTNVTPIYEFPEPDPFSGPEIYNPYEGTDTSHCWKRANFHTHSRIKGLMNECEKWPSEVIDEYEKYGYDIVTFSNHNRLTQHPDGEDSHVNLYEHGYNLFKYHKLVFGAEKVRRFDHLLPYMASHKQFQINLLSKDADIIQINHPLRTSTISKRQLEKISGYRLIELDSGLSTENEYWDWALSAGHYSFGSANDDLHYPDRSEKIAVRCSFLCTPSARYEDILDALNQGCFYSMRIPDYGGGDWEQKTDGNRTIPYISEIGVKDSTIFIRLSEKADQIRLTGQNHKTITTASGCDSLEYVMKDSDTYVRITAYFQDGEVLYTNPFARYDPTLKESPFIESQPNVNILLTILYNLALIIICISSGYIFYKFIIKK